MKPEVILLDCGGTLSWPPFDRLDKIISDLRGKTIGIEAHYRAFSRGTHALDHYLFTHKKYPANDSFMLNHWVYEQGIEREGYPGLWTVDCTKEVLRREKRLGRWDYTFEWVEKSLIDLKAAGFRLGVVSNADGHVQELLEGLGYSRFMETIVDSFVENTWKPDPELFYIAMDRMGLADYKQQARDAAKGMREKPPVLYVGDTYRSDYEGALNAGLQVTLVDPLGLYKGWVPNAVENMAELVNSFCGSGALG